MKIIIVGCGKVGTALTAQLSREDNLVTVIDTDSIVVRNVSNTYDVMGIVGNGASYQVLQEADIEHADLMIAVTKSDEMRSSGFWSYSILKYSCISSQGKSGISMVRLLFLVFGSVMTSCPLRR